MPRRRPMYLSKVHLVNKLDDATKYHRSHLVELGLISVSQWNRAREATDPNKRLRVEDQVFIRGREMKDYFRRQIKRRYGLSTASELRNQ